MSTKQGSPSIAICGAAGISGLTLAGILWRALADTGARITVFERASRDRDQGYGLDLNEHGQEALARAGVRRFNSSGPAGGAQSPAPFVLNR